MGNSTLEKLKSTIEHGRFIDISILQDVFSHLRKYDNPSRRKEHNYISKISEETNISKVSIIKVIEIFEEMDLVEREANGRKNTIKLKVSEKS